MKFKALAAAAIMSLSAASSADAVTFNLGGLGAGVSEFTLDFGGITDGVIISATNGGFASNFSAKANGIGVGGAPEGTRIGLGEQINISFSAAVFALFPSVRINAATFAETSTGTETFALALNGAQSVVSVDGSTPGSIKSIDGPFPVSVLTSDSDVFSVIGIIDDAGTNGIRLSSFTAAVPLPLPAALLATGLFGLGFAARRRAKA